MALGDLRYDQVALKAAHNSIDRDATVLEQLSGTGLVEPCRGLELDIHQSETEFTWTVKHGAHDPGTPFEDVLAEVAGWCDANPNHPVLTIHVDLKNEPLADADFAVAFDGLLASTLGGARLYQPREVMGSHLDLVRGARAGGWATMDELRGKVVVCLSGRARRKQAYAGTVPRARLCFADFAGSRGRPSTGTRVFANLFVEATRYRENLGSLVRVAGFITRGYNIVRPRLWDISEDDGLNVFATDALASAEFSLGGTGFRELTVTRRVDGVGD